jgi:hypothetical protein
MNNEAQEDATDQQVAADDSEPTQTATREPVRARRCELRRVNGQYELHMRDQHMQSFCSQFEDITRYALPEGCSQQVRINIYPVGAVRELATEDARDRMTEFRDEGRAQIRGAQVAGAGRAPALSEDSVEEMEIELPDRGEGRNDRMRGLLQERVEQVANFGRGPDRPPSWRDDLRAQLQRESTSLRMMLDFLERM